MAMACPKKKEIIRKKRNIAKQKEQDQKEQTYASLEANELSTKIFASETKVPKRILNPSSIKVYFMLGHIKYQIADPNISADHIESLTNQEKLYSKKDNTAFLPETEYKKIRNGHSNRSPPEKQPVKKKSKK